MEFIEKIFYRKINPSDFKKMYDIDRPTSGGGQTYLEAAGINNEQLVEFLSYGEISDSPLANESRYIYTINAYVLGKKDIMARLEFAPRGGRNNYRISRQTIRQKHPAWAVENGFPEPLKNEEGKYISENNFSGIIDNLIIMIFRTSYKKYYASFFNSDRIPDSWPKNINLNTIVESDRRGVIDISKYKICFNNNIEVPFDISSQDDFGEENRSVGGSNILLYGVPGSGKSHTIKKDYCNERDKIERVVFHPDYTYSDFVGQILPSLDGNGMVRYNFNPGPFTRLLERAEKNKEYEYYLIIEEINRGNAPAIFGEVFQLLDREEDGTSTYGISNADIAKVVYNNEDHLVIIPSNMHILATMNTSDQNVFTLDTAFQRRWTMRIIENDVKSAKYANKKILDTNISWLQFNEVINSLILESNSRMSSSEDKRLGAYFVKENDLTYDAKENDENATNDERVSAARQNSKFPEKILKYLWDDAFKFSREIIFNIEQYSSLEDIIKHFKKQNGNQRFKVFKEDLFNLNEA